MLLRYILILSVLFVSAYASAQKTAEKNRQLHNPVFVRIRMFKDLKHWPELPGADMKRVNAQVWRLSGDDLVFQHKQLSKLNFVVKKESGLFDLISVFDFNRYLAGVVSGEVPGSWPLEALKAQAVVARSFALARINERQQKNFHLDSDQSDQVYNAKITAKSIQAVYETDGVILLTDTDRVLKAFYHADCGGQTVRASDVWGNKTFDGGTAADPWCAGRESNKWQFQVSKESFLSALAVMAERSLSTPQSTLNFENKAQLLEIGDSLFSVQKLRQLFGFSNIRSTISRIDFTGDSVQISGQGYGHGAGLCQWGTLAQVKLGKSYEDVLRHYYPKAKIARQVLKLGSLNDLNSAL